MAHFRKNTASKQGRFGAFRFLAVLVATLGSNTCVELAKAGEIVLVEVSGLFSPEIEVKYKDRDGDIARCSVSRDKEFMNELETFIIAGFADFKFPINWRDNSWKDRGSFREKQKFEITCETIKFLNADHKNPQTLERYIYHPKEQIPEKERKDLLKKSDNQATAVPTSDGNANSNELLAAKRKANELEQQLAALKAQQKQQQQTISSDKQKPFINIAGTTMNGPQGTIKGYVRDNTGIAEVRVDGQLVEVDSYGNFLANTYVPDGGINVSIEAVDLAGLTSSISVRLERRAPTAAVTFDRLDPLGREVAANKDALALIIGIDSYKSTPARAIYADSDAEVFADYASQKLGIPTNRIKTLVNDGAGERELLLSVKSWLTRSVRQNQSDVYIFFAGHGLAADDGSKMYLLPYDGAPELLDDTAIQKNRLFGDVAAANPRSVTVFLDTCYSGTTRGTDMLIVSRPIAIRALEQSIPDKFTVMTAAAGDQTAKPLEEAKHGMFSYFLMKGMEGEADTNKNNEITAGELHSYVQTNVIQQSSGSQTPELQGDAARVLVRFQ